MMLSYIAARVDGPSPHDLFVAPLAGGAARNLTGASIDRPIGSYTWRADGRIVALVATGFTSAVFEIDPAGQAKRLAGFNQLANEMAVSREGLYALVSETSADPAEVWLWDGRGAAQRVTNFNDLLRAAGLRPMEVVRYKSFDGTEIEAGLLTPAGYDGKSKLPFVVLPHGGPTGRYADEFNNWAQLLAARGFAVMLPNIRGSTGYGSKFVESNRADWGGGDFKDVMAGVDYAIARGLADPERLGIGGWSYGGYMTEWAITQTNRFKAGVCGAGLADLASEFGTENGSSYDEWFYGLPYEKLDGFVKSSPVTYIKNARTPTLILQGAADTTDPIGQSQQLYRPLKRYGVETDFVVYPREGHGIREENHRLDVLRRMTAWFEKYLK
jgi:dipeptidyl aminopeptidase/acylaminoacyl peptidase